MANVIAGLIAQQIENALTKVVKLDGPNPCDPKIYDRKAFFNRVATEGMLGLGDSFVRGDWDVQDIRGFFIKALNAGLLEMVASSKAMKVLRKLQTKGNPQANLKTTIDMLNAHYDRGNVLFQNMLRGRLTYTCDIWEDPMSLDVSEDQVKAQERKLDLVCRKLNLKPRQRLLDIGAGWGPLSGFAARKFDVQVVAVTPVPQQTKYIRDTYKSDGVEVLEVDYRNLPRDLGRFDAVAGVGVAEHIGRKNFPVLMKIINGLLKPDGLALLHFFGRTSDDVPLIDPWTEKHIFPGAYLPTLQEVLNAAEPFFGISDIQEIGRHYDKTLIAWHRNFTEAWESKIKPLFEGGGEDTKRFYRMWTYYLQIAAAGFHTRKLWLWQIVFQPRCSRLYYKSVR